MKVAFLLHGQIRLLHEVFDDIKEKILDTYTPDVYCQVWWDEDVEKNGYESINKKYYPPENAIEELKKTYNPKKLRIDKNYKKINEDGNEWSSEIYVDYPKLLSYKMNPSVVDYFGQFLSIQNVSNLFNWEGYDFIVKWRYDFKPINFPKLENLNKNKFYVQSDLHNTLSNKNDEFIDTCFILPNDMKNYLDIFNHLNDDASNEDGRQSISPNRGCSPESVYSHYLNRLNYLDRLVKLPYGEFTTIKITK